MSFSSVEGIQHIAVIMDGNGRWAQKRKLPRTAGHRAGVKIVRNIIELCQPHRIQCLTLFAFSSENWQRPRDEVDTLMDLFLNTLSKETAALEKNNVRLRFIGDRLAFKPKLQEKINEAELRTRHNTGLSLSIAVNYGGRWDISQAVCRLAQEVQSGKLKAEDIGENTVSSYLSLADLPMPDLLIRTGGEYRISNFLLWQLAYAELYFTEVLWPDFGEAEWNTAIDWFYQRQRRFGGISTHSEGQIC